MKKKVTLLIALSIIIALVVSFVSCGKKETVVIVTDKEISSQIESSFSVVIPESMASIISSDIEKIEPEYPEAQLIWDTIISWGWSQEVAAGILGNMMRECGGDTFKLKWTINGGHRYGLCQWTGQRKQSILKKYGKQPSILEQLEFMKDELEGTNGVTRQVNEKNYRSILSSKTASAAATKFAAYFERPASNYYGRRAANAKKAFNYFKATID